MLLLNETKLLTFHKWLAKQNNSSQNVFLCHRNLFHEAESFVIDLNELSIILVTVNSEIKLIIDVFVAFTLFLWWDSWIWWTHASFKVSCVHDASFTLWKSEQVGSGFQVVFARCTVIKITFTMWTCNIFLLQLTSNQHQIPCRQCRFCSKFHCLRNRPKNCSGSLEKLLDFLQSADKIAMHENDHKDFQLLHQALMVKLYFHIQDVTSRHLDRSRSIQLGFAFQVGHRWSEWFEHSQRRFLKLHRQCLQRVDLRV